MTQASKLKELKNSIRAILNSSQQVLRANDLYRDYKNFEGSELPFRNFGYRTVVEFLRSLSDTVEIIEPFNPNPLLKLVEDNKTLHIAKLVTHQKITNNKPSRYRPKRTTPKTPPVCTSIITYEFRMELWNILSGFPKGMSLIDFKRDVEKLIPHYLSHNFTIEEILSGISDFARVDHNRNVIYLLPQARRNENIVCNATPVDRVSSPENERVVPSDSDSESDDDYHAELSSETCSNVKQPFLVNNMDEDDAESNSSYPHENNPLVNQTLIKNIRALFDEEENRDGIWSYELLDKYWRKFGYPLALTANGFPDVMDMVTNLTDVFTYYHYEMAGSYMLKDARKFPKSKESNAEDSKGSGYPEIPIALLREIKTLLRRSDDKSVYVDELTLAYQRIFHKTLNYHDYGFNNHDSFLRSLDQCQEIFFRNSQQRTVLSLNEQSRSDTTNANADDVSLNFPSYNPFPRDVCGVDFKLDPDPLLEKFQKREKYNVKVAEIYTPGKFYLHFETNVEKLSRMMDDLNTFYDNNEESYEVLPSVIMRGLLCVCRYSVDSKWHRVSLMTADLENAKAKFVDYGTVETVKVVDLRYLHRNYAVLPALCFRAKLAGIRPKKESSAMEGEIVYYSKIINNKFYNHVKEAEVLQAELIEHNVQGESYEVNLMACIDGLSRSIGQALIDENLVAAESHTTMSETLAKKGKKTTPKSIFSKVPDIPKISTEQLPTTLENTVAYEYLPETLIPKSESPPPPPPPSSSSSFPSDNPINDELTKPKVGPPPGLNYSSSLPRLTNPSYYNLTTIPAPVIEPFYSQHYASPTYVGSGMYPPMKSPLMPPQSTISYPPPCPMDTTYPYNLQPRVPVPPTFANVRPPPGLCPVYQSSIPPGFVQSPIRYTTPSPYYNTVPFPQTSIVTGQNKVSPYFTAAPFSYAPVVTGQNLHKNELSGSVANSHDKKGVTFTSAPTKSPRSADNFELTSNSTNMNVSENSANKETLTTHENTLQHERIREKIGVENSIQQYFMTNFANFSVEQEEIEDRENYVTKFANSPRQKFADKVDIDKTHTSKVNSDSVPQSICSSNISDSKASTVDGSKNTKLNPIRQFVLRHGKQMS